MRGKLLKAEVSVCHFAEGWGEGLVFILTLLTLARVDSIADGPQPPCGVESVLALAKLVQVEVTDSEQLLDEDEMRGVLSLEVLQRLGARFGLRTLGVEADTNDLLNEHTPAIVNLQNPPHFAVLLDGDPDFVRLLDAGELRIVARQDFERRFSRRALVLVENPHEASPVVEVLDPHRELDLATAGEEVIQNFTIRNMGVQDLEIELLERP